MNKDQNKLVVGGQQGRSDKRLMEKTEIYQSQVPDGTERSSLVSGGGLPISLHTGGFIVDESSSSRHGAQHKIVISDVLFLVDPQETNSCPVTFPSQRETREMCGGGVVDINLLADGIIIYNFAFQDKKTLKILHYYITQFVLLHNLLCVHALFTICYLCRIVRWINIVCQYMVVNGYLLYILVALCLNSSFSSRVLSSSKILSFHVFRRLLSFLILLFYLSFIFYTTFGNRRSLTY